MADDDQPKKQELNWNNMAEILPDNERTEKIMKQRAEEEEIRR